MPKDRQKNLDGAVALQLEVEAVADQFGAEANVGAWGRKWASAGQATASLSAKTEPNLYCSVETVRGTAGRDGRVWDTSNAGGAPASQPDAVRADRPCRARGNGGASRALREGGHMTDVATLTRKIDQLPTAAIIADPECQLRAACSSVTVTEIGFMGDTQTKQEMNTCSAACVATGCSLKRQLASDLADLLQSPLGVMCRPSRPLCAASGMRR